MNIKLLTLFKKRFNEIRKIEAREAAKASLKQKFQQLASLISMAIGLGINLNKGRKEQMIKTNWQLLKAKA